jgi:hypothetical protein
MMLFIKVTFLMGRDMGKGSKYGKMEASMKDIGTKIRPMAKVDWYILMGMYILENGLMIKLKAKGYICIKTDLSIRVLGLRINKMVMAWKYWLMVLDLRVIIK